MAPCFTSPTALVPSLRGTHLSAPRCPRRARTRSSTSAWGPLRACAAQTSGGAAADGGYPPVIFVLGGPGSGKGTQCARLVGDFGCAQVTVGDLLRGEAASGSDEGQVIAQIMQAGRIVPSAITMRLLRGALATAATGGAPAVLVDGFPRNMEQAAEFERIVAAPRFVLFYSCPMDEMRRRIVERGRTSGRADDDDLIVTSRLDTYMSKTMPVIRHYESRGLLREVDAGAGNAAVVYEATRAVVLSEMRGAQAVGEAV